MFFPKNKKDANYGISQVYSATGGPRHNFDPAAIRENRFQCGDGELVRIPRIQGRIVQRKQNHSTYVEYVYEREYDPETKQTRNKRKIIGIIIEPYEGFMMPNENYYQLFDPDTGELLYPEEKAEEEPEERKDQMPTESKSEDAETEQAEADEEQASDRTAEAEREAAENAIRQETARRLREEARRREMEERQQEAEETRRVNEELQAYRETKAALELYNNILFNELETIQEMSKKRPTDVVSRYKIQKINITLKKIRDLLAETEVSDFLDLLEEPREEKQDGRTVWTGLTFSDATILLVQYYHAAHWYYCKMKPGWID